MLIILFFFGGSYDQLIRNTYIDKIYCRNHHHQKIGSNVTCNIDWKICKELTWTSRLFCFTNYKSVVAEWENTFNFKINKFLSSTLYLYPRFDDAYHSDKSHAKIQFKEYLSMGLDWSFDF